MVLLDHSAPNLPSDQRDAATRIILEITGGNTLGVVFAAAEAASYDSAEGLHDRLKRRRLQSGITGYYQHIWNHCVDGLPPEVGIVLAGSIALARERITGEFLTSAFPGLNRPAQQWNLLLGRLGPLLLHEADGYRIRHNDLRVFLQGSVASLPAAQRREIASGFADHYKKPKANRQVAHQSLLFFLREGGRETEWPQIFTVSWVMEAAGLGFEYEDIEDQCIAALQIASASQDWDLMGDVACACDTLERWRERCEGDRPGPLIRKVSPSPVFLRTEVFVRPLNEWESSDLNSLAADGEELLKAGENSRAVALLNRWLTGLDVTTICDRVRDKNDVRPFTGEDTPRLSPEANDSFERLGSTCRLAGVVLPAGKFKGLSAQAAFAVEKGWFQTSSEIGPFDSLSSCFLNQQPRFLATVVETATIIAMSGKWSLLKELLIVESKHREALAKRHRSFAYRAAWWSLRSGAASESRIGLPSSRDRKPGHSRARKKWVQL